MRYVDPDGRWDVAFGDISFGKYDIFTPTKQVNTGNKFADFWLAGICGISNLCAVPFNYAANVLGLVDEGITWLDERWPSEWTCTGISIRADIDAFSIIYATNPKIFLDLGIKIKSVFLFTKNNIKNATSAKTYIFYTGFGGKGEDIAKAYALENGGITLDMTSIRAKLPEYNSQTKHLWDEASRIFAQQATGDVTVLIGPSVSGTSTFNRIEFEALQQNPNVNSIQFILME